MEVALVAFVEEGDFLGICGFKSTFKCCHEKKEKLPLKSALTLKCEDCNSGPGDDLNHGFIKYFSSNLRIRTETVTV